MSFALAAFNRETRVTRAWRAISSKASFFSGSSRLQQQRAFLLEQKRQPFVDPPFYLRFIQRLPLLVDIEKILEKAMHQGTL